MDRYVFKQDLKLIHIQIDHPEFVQLVDDASRYMTTSLVMYIAMTLSLMIVRYIARDCIRRNSIVVYTSYWESKKSKMHLTKGL